MQAIQVTLWMDAKNSGRLNKIQFILCGTQEQKKINQIYGSKSGSEKPALLCLPLISCLRCTGAGRSWHVQTAASASVCIGLVGTWYMSFGHLIAAMVCETPFANAVSDTSLHLLRLWGAPDETWYTWSWLLPGADKAEGNLRSGSRKCKLKTVLRLLQISFALVAECDRISLLGGGHCCVCWRAVTWNQAGSNGWKCQARHWVPPMGRQGSTQRGSGIALGGIISLPQTPFPRPCLWIGLHCIIMSAVPGKYHCYMAVSWSQLQCEHQLQLRPLPHNVWFTNITDFISEWRETNLVCSQSKHLWNDLG